MWIRVGHDLCGLVMSERRVPESVLRGADRERPYAGRMKPGDKG